MNNICPLCKNKNSSTHVLKYLYKDPIFKNKNIYLCAKCNVYYVWPIPNSLQLESYYKNTLETSIGSKKASFLNQSFATMLAKVRVAYINKIVSEKTIKKKINVLEIGPGYGHLSKQLISKYKIKDYDTIEFDNECHTQLNEYGINTYFSIEDINKDKKYDLIILSHTLEHISNPTDFIFLLKNRLNYNSYIFIDVPCEDWKYKNIAEPHLFFFNKDSLKKIIDINSLQVIDMSYVGEEIHLIRKPKNYFINKILYKIEFIINFILIFFFNKRDNFTATEKIFIKKFRSNKVNIAKSRWIRTIAKKI